MNKKKFYQKLIKRRKEVMDQPSVGKNCASTALYLIAETRKDEIPYSKKYLDESSRIDRLYEKIQNLKLSEKPEIGYLIEWHARENLMFHTGVIVKLNPLSISHRAGYEGEFVKCQNISEIVEEKMNLKRTFRVPSKLQKILGRN